MKREYLIIFLIALAVIYTAYDLAVALFKKSDRFHKSGFSFSSGYNFIKIFFRYKG